MQFAACPTHANLLLVTPSATQTLVEDGRVVVRALRDIEVDEELTISYVDATGSYDDRRKTLTEHYGFECRCERCTIEKKAELKRNMELKKNYLAGQRR